MNKQQFDALMAHREAEEAQRQQSYNEHLAWLSEIHGKRARGEVPSPIPTFDEIFGASRAAQEIAEAEAERLRIAALTPRDILLSTLSWQERQHIEKWEAVNPGLQYPLETLGLKA